MFLSMVSKGMNVKAEAPRSAVFAFMVCPEASVFHRHTGLSMRRKSPAQEDTMSLR